MNNELSLYLFKAENKDIVVSYDLIGSAVQMVSLLLKSTIRYNVDHEAKDIGHM